MKLHRGRNMTFIQYDLNELVDPKNELKIISGIIPFVDLLKEIEIKESKVGRNGYGLEVGIKCLFLQFYYDLSDREMENRLKYDISFKWFCNFSISDATPDYSYFSRCRKAIGTQNIGKFFHAINKRSKDKKLFHGVFHFADSSKIKAKESTWTERDKSLLDHIENLNNNNINKYSVDKDAKFGCKGKNDFWFGYKRHHSVDMSSGLIEKVAVTPANKTDQEGLKHICPIGGMIFGDKAYCLKRAQIIMQSRGCHSGAILKNNMQGKNKYKDNWLTKVRIPFENTFSKLSKKTRYRGLMKTQMQAFLEAIVFNTKRLVVLRSQNMIDFL